jgi:hypothetical protein
VELSSHQERGRLYSCEPFQVLRALRGGSGQSWCLRSSAATLRQGGERAATACGGESGGGGLLSARGGEQVVAACGAEPGGGGGTAALWDLRRAETARVGIGGSTRIYCGRLRCGIRGRRQDSGGTRWWGQATTGSGSDRGLGFTADAI